MSKDAHPEMYNCPGVRYRAESACSTCSMTAPLLLLGMGLARLARPARMAAAISCCSSAVGRPWLMLHASSRSACMHVGKDHLAMAPEEFN